MTSLNKEIFSKWTDFLFLYYVSAMIVLIIVCRIKLIDDLFILDDFIVYFR